MDTKALTPCEWVSVIDTFCRISFSYTAMQMAHAEEVREEQCLQYIHQFPPSYLDT